MCSSCKHATLIFGRSSLLLERDGRKTPVFNVPCLTCLNCDASSFDDAILAQYQSYPGATVTLLRPEEALAVVA